MEKQNAYMERKIDYKKIWILYWQRVWLVITLTAAAAAIGAGVYNVVRALNSEGDIYRVSSDYYITFNEDENGADYYNAYTWDTILRDDPVVDVVMENLPDSVSKDEVKAAVTGEMLGDYRILTVHATSADPEFAQMVAKAYIKGLGQFADKISMLDTIELWSQEEVALVVEEDLTANAAILGAVVGLFLGVILWLYPLNLPANLENSAVAIELEKVSFHSNSKEGQCQRMFKLPHNRTHLMLEK